MKRIQLIHDIPVDPVHVLLADMICPVNVRGAKGAPVRVLPYEYRFLKEGSEPAREWVVYSTAIAQGWLMLQCNLTGATGSVRDPSQEEWAAGFSASRDPYRWTEDDRVFVDPETRSNPVTSAT